MEENMSWWAILLWCMAGYLFIGFLVSLLLMQTPYSDNGILLIIALWPLFVIGLLTGG